MTRKIWIAMCFLAPFGVVAQEVAPKPLPQVPMVIEPTDADAFREIVAITPQQWQALYIRWYTTILQRQQQKQAETTVKAKPEREQ
jgi:hypothetical protein